MNPNLRNFALWTIIFLLVLALVTLFQNQGSRQSSIEIPYSQFLDDVDAGRVERVVISGNEITGIRSGSGPFSTYAPQDPRNRRAAA